MSVAITILGIHDSPAFLVEALGFLGGSVAVTLLMRGRVDLFDDRVELVRWFGFSSKLIRLSEIARVEPDPYGIHFRLHDGTVVSGPTTVGQKGPGLYWLGYKNRGDRISEAIMTAVAVAANR